MQKLLLMGALVLGLLTALIVQATDFLPPEQAFRYTATVKDKQTVVVQFTIAPGYYLYRERFAFSADPALLGTPQLPMGLVKFDENFDKNVETYHDTVQVALPLTAQTDQLQLHITLQGCAEAGLCYPPQQSTVSLSFDLADAGNPAGQPALNSNSALTAKVPADATGDRINRALQSGNLLVIVPVFLVLGLLLALTPCVLPMLPILSSIIVGDQTAQHSRQQRRQRSFLLSLAYSLGMALVYTALGIAAGLIGEGLSAALQKPWVLVLFALLLVTLALSMFGLYELQLPARLRDKLSQNTSSSRGNYLGVFIMGALSALIVSPCVAAPLAGALLYISQTRNVIVGGGALFALAMGMSVPLLLIGLSAGSLLPKAGGWMVRVKQFFGIVLLGVAVWIVSPVLPEAYRPFARLYELFNPHEKTVFQRVRNEAELDAALQQAQQAGQPVLFDFYADWCVSCIEMEKHTFVAPQVKPLLAQIRLLQVDVTANTADDKALLKRFNLFGPPGIILYNAQGQEQRNARVIGFMSPDAFAERLQSLGLSNKTSP